VKLTIVGCAPAWTRRPGRASSCYLVQHGGKPLVLDMGQGAFAELARYREPALLSGVLLSHLHPDHFIDLVPLRHYLKYEARPAEPLALHGPAQLGTRLDGLLAESGFLAGMNVAALEPGNFSVAGMDVEAGRVTHIPDSFAFRLSLAGTSAGLVYSGDCGRAEDLLPLIHTGDVLLCEAAHGADQADPSGIHLNAAAAAGVGARGGAGTLILTHLLDRSERIAALTAAEQTFGGEVLLAEPGLELEVA
jgi:ribonuclease BN (tRNA processing enzyme)